MSNEIVKEGYLGIVDTSGDKKFTGVLVNRTLEEAVQDDIIADAKKSIEEYGYNGPLTNRQMRPSKNTYYLGIAKAVCKRSTCLKRRHGVVIVNNDEVIATGYNGNPRGIMNCCDVGRCVRYNKPHNTGDYSDCHSVHAEQNAMLSASRKDMIGGTMYMYAEDEVDGIIKEVPATPCPICARMILNAGIKTIYNINGVVNIDHSKI